MYPVDFRFFDIIGYSMESLLIWGYKTYSEEYGSWFVSLNDAREFCKAIGENPDIADI